MTPKERAEAYHRAFPKWPMPQVNGRWLNAVWIMGNNYKGTGYYGAYPSSYLKRVLALFPDVQSRLHLFSGSLLPSEIEGDAAPTFVDINPSLGPHVIVANAEELSSVIQGRYDLILADPPYSEDHAKRYGFPLPNKRKVIDECYRVLHKGGHLAWLDTSLPMHSKEQWIWWGLIGISVSTNHVFRCLSLFTKQ